MKVQDRLARALQTEVDMANRAQAAVQVTQDVRIQLIFSVPDPLR